MTAPILISLLFIIAACNPSKQNHAADSLQDGDITEVETEPAVSDDFILVENENDIMDDTLITDADTAEPDCPPLIEAKFPYYREGGTIHFCRKCDTPTAKDPQCVTNLWKEANLKLTTDFPEADCYPYPCEMGNLYPRTKDQYYSEEPDAPQYVAMHECDLKLTNYGWDGDSTRGQIKHWNISEGKIGFVMYKVSLDNRIYPTFKRHFIYDPVTKKYMVRSPSDDGFAYHQGNALLYFRDARSHELSGNHYIGYFTSDGTYQVVYPKQALYIIYTPALNEKWVFANVQEVQNGPTKMMYAKIGEWKWTTLGDGVGNHPDLYGDLLAFYDDNAKGYVCDLSKGPKSLGGCTIVNREAEQVRNIQFDRSGASRFVYSSNWTEAIVLVDYSQGFDKMTYTDIITDFTPESASQPWALYVERLNGDVLLYREITMDNDATLSGGRACFYRLDTKQKHCMKKMENDKQYGDWVVFPYGHSEYEGDWFLYQKQNNSPLILRDMKCYCEKEGVCPFEGLKK